MLQFKILLNLCDMQWLNMVRKCRCQFHGGSVQLLCPEQKAASISQSYFKHHIYMYIYFQASWLLFFKARELGSSSTSALTGYGWGGNPLLGSPSCSESLP